MEEELSDVKRSNMAASEAGEKTEMTENSSTEPSLTEIREMLANIQTSMANILKENKSVKTELTELKAAYQEQNLPGIHQEREPLVKRRAKAY